MVMGALCRPNVGERVVKDVVEEGRAVGEHDGEGKGVGEVGRGGAEARVFALEAGRGWLTVLGYSGLESMFAMTMWCCCIF